MPHPRLLALLLLVAVLAVAAGCGGSGGSTASNGDTAASTVDVPDGAVAVVDGTAIPQAAFDEQFAQYQAAYKAQGQDFPAVGSPEYEQLRTKIVDFLVQREELEREAAALGITVTDQEVDDRLGEVKQQFFQGDEAKYQEELKSLGITEEALRNQLRSSLLSQRLYDEITKDVTVTDDEVQAYYDEHVEEFKKPETRELAHILVKSEAEAKEIRQKLEDGADFAKLAKEKSLDETSAVEGGTLPIQPKEGWVKPFGDAAWALETGELSQPVESEFGWHIIKALGDIEPEATTPFADVKDTIREQTLKGKRDKAMDAWVQDVRAKFATKVGYAIGFAPSDSPLTVSTLPQTGG